MSGRTACLSSWDGTSPSLAAHGRRRARGTPGPGVSLGHEDRNALHRVDAIAAAVPHVVGTQRLGLAVLVGRPGAELVVARLRGVPLVRPPHPAVDAARLVEARVGPRAPAVGAELHPPDPAAARPRAPGDRRASAGHAAQPREELGDAGRGHERPRPLAGDRVAGVAVVALVGVEDGLRDALERLRDGCDRPQPLHRRHAVPVGHHEPQRVPVRRRKRLSVHRVREEGVAGQRVGDRQAALVVVLDALVEPAVRAGEHDLDRVVEQSRLLEHAPQQRARPLGAPDRLLVPRSRDRPRDEVRAAGAGALHHDRHRQRRPSAQVVHRQSERSPDAAVDAQFVSGLVDRGHVEVDEHVVHADRRDRPAERLERDAGVAQREADLLARELLTLGDRHRRRAYRAGPGPVTRRARPARRGATLLASQPMEATMSTTPLSSDAGTETVGVPTVPMRFEVTTLPVADVDRAKAFYQRLGWRFDIDFKPTPETRGVQFTPPGSAASIQFGKGPEPLAGPLEALQLIVQDIDAARDDLISRGVEVGDIWHLEPGKGPQPGRDPEGRSYFTRAIFEDPDGNQWVLQEVNERLPGRVDATDVEALAQLLHETAEHHGSFENASPPHDWWDWYAAYANARQTGSTPEGADATADQYMADVKGVVASRP